MDQSIISNGTSRGRNPQNKFRFDAGLNFNQKVTSSSLSHIQKKYNFNTTTHFNTRERRGNNNGGNVNSTHSSGMLGKSSGFGFGEKMVRNNLGKMEGLYGMSSTTRGNVVRQLPTIPHRSQYFGAEQEMNPEGGKNIKISNQINAQNIGRDHSMNFAYKKKPQPKNTFGQKFNIGNNKNSIGKIELSSIPRDKSPY